MDNELLQALSNLLDKKLEPINKKLDDITAKLEAVHEQTADLTEFRTEINGKLDTIEKDLSNVEIITSSNWNDLAKLKAVK